MRRCADKEVSKGICPFESGVSIA